MTPAANVRGRGTTVLTACSHADVVNVGIEARRLVLTSQSTCCSAATTSPGPPSKTASNPRSATSPPRSSPGSSPRGAAPAGGPPPDLEALRELIETGEVVPTVDHTHPLSETAAAIHDVQRAGAYGARRSSRSESSAQDLFRPGRGQRPQ